MEYLVIYEKAGDNFSAYAPDLPGCIACGDTIDETRELMRDAISLYIETLRDDGVPAPLPVTRAETVTVG